MTLDSLLHELTTDPTFILNGTLLLQERPVRAGLGIEQVIVLENATEASLKAYFLGEPVISPLFASPVLVEVEAATAKVDGNKKSESK